MDNIQQRGRIYLVKVAESLDGLSIGAVFSVHFLFVLIALLSGKMCHYVSEGRVNDFGPYFALYNCFFFVTLLWSVHEPTRPAPLQMATMINLISIVLDTIVTVKSYDHVAWFAIIMIVNILLRPATSVVLLRKACQRKRRLNLLADENISLGAAIKGLIYNAPQTGTNECDSFDSNKTNTAVPRLNILSTVA